MANNNNYKDNVLTYKKIVVPSAFFISLIGGIIAGAISIIKFENYKHPYFFGFLFGTLGLSTGLLIAKRIKPYVIISSIMKSNYSQLSFMFSIGLIGWTLLLGQNINKTLSTLEKCDQYPIIDKHFKEAHYRQPELNILVVNIDQQSQKILCKHTYWETVFIGQKINICIYKSKIGFDYFELENK